MSPKPYLKLSQYVEGCLEKFGDNARGVGWPKPEDAATRYQVMLEVRRGLAGKGPWTLLDFGCGASHLYDYILHHRIRDFRYSGLDLSPRLISLSRSKHPKVRYFCTDVLSGRPNLPMFDVVIMNGVFTLKLDLSY
jgi:SAM-dependent methyltransferase